MPAQEQERPAGGSSSGAAAAAPGGRAEGDENDGAPSTSGIVYRQYRDERDLPALMELIDRDLSEPYSIFTYRYFVAQWPTLCFLAVDPTGGAGRTAVVAAADDDNNDAKNNAKNNNDAKNNAKNNNDANPQPKKTNPPVILPDGEGAAAGVVVCKAEPHRDRGLVRGYLAMLVVDKGYRGKGLGAALARRAIAAMRDHPCDELALEAEAGNKAALALYRSLGFLRDKRLHRYYLNGADAYRLKLLLPRGRSALERMREEKLRAAAGMGMEEDLGEGEDLEEQEEGERRAADEAAEALAGLEVGTAAR